MDIVYINQHFRTPAMASGTRSWEFSRRLVGRGHRVHVLTAVRSDSASPGAAPLWRVSEEEGATVHWCRVPYSHKMGFRDRVASFARFAVRCAARASSLPQDVVFATSTPLTVAIPGIYSKRRNGVPMVFEVRDVWPEVPIALGMLGNPVLRKAALALEAAAYRESTEIIALSPQMAESITSRFPGVSVTVIPNSSDVDLFTDPDPAAVTAARAERPWLGKQPLLIYTGTFGPANDVGYLVDVAAELRTLAPEVRVLLVGDGKQYEAVRQRARRLGVLEENLFMEPPIAKRDLPALLAAADLGSSVFADIPALAANSPNKAFDAFAAGRPVLVNNGGWLADVIDETGAGIAAPRDPAAAARLVAERISDPDWKRTARAAARTLAATRFNRDLLFEQFEEVLERAAHSHQVAP